MLLRRVKISAILFAWVLFLIHSVVPHHHVEELIGIAASECIGSQISHHHTHAGANNDGLPYLNHAEEFGSRLIKTDPLVLKLDNHGHVSDFNVPLAPVPFFAKRLSFSSLPVFAAVANKALAKQLYLPRLRGRAPPTCA